MLHVNFTDSEGCHYSVACETLEQVRECMITAEYNGTPRAVSDDDGVVAGYVSAERIHWGTW